jgi:hypothetical protein
MWRVALVVLVLSAGCASSKEEKNADEPWIFGAHGRDIETPKAHESSGEVAEDIAGGIIGGIAQFFIDVFTGANN